jgi:hypothetical protein
MRLRAWCVARARLELVGPPLTSRPVVGRPREPPGRLSLSQRRRLPILVVYIIPHGAVPRRAAVGPPAARAGGGAGRGARAPARSPAPARGRRTIWRMLGLRSSPFRCGAPQAPRVRAPREGGRASCGVHSGRQAPVSRLVVARTRRDLTKSALGWSGVAGVRGLPRGSCRHAACHVAVRALRSNKQCFPHTYPPVPSRTAAAGLGAAGAQRSAAPRPSHLPRARQQPWAVAWAKPLLTCLNAYRGSVGRRGHVTGPGYLAAAG